MRRLLGKIRKHCSRREACMSSGSSIISHRPSRAELVCVSVPPPLPRITRCSTSMYAAANILILRRPQNSLGTTLCTERSVDRTSVYPENQQQRQNLEILLLQGKSQ
jgi:hypothetical protein